MIDYGLVQYLVRRKSFNDHQDGLKITQVELEIVQHLLRFQYTEFILMIKVFQKSSFHSLLQVGMPHYGSVNY